jgi:hypothetical protein
MSLSISSSVAYQYLTDHLGSEENSCPTKPLKDTDPWAGKPICKDDRDLDPNCCCDGYSIESVIDQAYEYGLGNRHEVKMLEKYPCISCLSLDAITEKLADIAARLSKHKTPSSEGDELKSMSGDIDRFIAAE